MRTHWLILPVLALAACSHERKSAPVETTAAQMNAEATRNEIAQLQRERNEARAALAEERNARDLERERNMTEAAQRREHDELELRVLSALEKAGGDMETLRDKAAKANAKQRKEVNAALSDAKSQKESLSADLRKLHGDIGKPWEEFRAEVDAKIQSLDQTLASATESKARQPTEQKAKTPGEPKAKPTTPDQQQLPPPTRSPEQQPGRDPTRDPGREPGRDLQPMGP